MLTHKRKKAGQALVEFALSITLIFLLLSATIDLGLAFFAYQGISGAAQEGASYGSLFPMNGNTLNYASIRDRARYEGGANAALAHRARFVDLMDLDNDDKPDTAAVVEAQILVSVVKNSVNDNPNVALVCSASKITVKYCDMVVRVNYNYKPFFSAAKMFGLGEIKLFAQRQMTIAR